jgi:hypothetical protein
LSSFEQTDDQLYLEKASNHTDTSAIAIAAAGMFRLARQLDNNKRDQIRQHGETLLDALTAHHPETDSNAQGLLREDTCPDFLGATSHG